MDFLFSESFCWPEEVDPESGLTVDSIFDGSSSLLGKGRDMIREQLAFLVDWAAR